MAGDISATRQRWNGVKAHNLVDDVQTHGVGQDMWTMALRLTPRGRPGFL